MDVAFSMCLPRDETSVPFVRHLCRGTLDGLGVTSGCIHDIVLALTEACTNVLRHASADDEYSVEIEIDVRVCRISVSDRGPGFDHSGLQQDTVSMSAESGRGIHVMRALVDDLQFVSEIPNNTVVRLTKRLELRSSSPLRVMSARDEGEPNATGPTARMRPRGAAPDGRKTSRRSYT